MSATLRYLNIPSALRGETMQATQQVSRLYNGQVGHLCPNVKVVFGARNGAPEINHVANALGVAQFGGRHPSAKPWRGQGPGVFEVVADYGGNTYRAADSVRFHDVVYVLHAFQKKSPNRIRTAQPDIDMVARRLKIAQQDHQARHAKPNR